MKRKKAAEIYRKKAAQRYKSTKSTRHMYAYTLGASYTQLATFRQLYDNLYISSIASRIGY